MGRSTRSGPIGFHDSFKRALTGGSLDELRAAFASFGDSWQDAVVYAKSHDEVGNTDDRIAKRGRDGKGWEMAQLAATGTVLARGMPMLFMGQEAGDNLQFGQDDGRVSPDTAPTWWDDRLPLGTYETDPGRAKVLGWYERMLEIRRGDLGRLAAGDIAITHLNNANGIVAFTRDGGKCAGSAELPWHLLAALRCRGARPATGSWPIPAGRPFNCRWLSGAEPGRRSRARHHGRHHSSLRRGGAGPVGLTSHNSIKSALDTPRQSASVRPKSLWRSSERAHTWVFDTCSDQRETCTWTTDGSSWFASGPMRSGCGQGSPDGHAEQFWLMAEEECSTEGHSRPGGQTQPATGASVDRCQGRRGQRESSRRAIRPHGPARVASADRRIAARSGAGTRLLRPAMPPERCSSRAGS